MPSNIVSYSHDQTIRINSGMYEQVLAEVDDKIEQSLVAGSPDAALDFAYDLMGTGHLRLIQLAKLFYEISRPKVWAAFQTDDTPADAIFKALGVSERKFIEYKEMYEWVLKDRPQLAGKPINGLIELTVAAREGEFSDEDWDEIAHAYDKGAMLAIRRRVRGVQTSGHGRLVGLLDRDGHVWAKEGDGEKEHAAFLEVGAASESAAGKLVARLIKNGGLLRQ